MNEKLYIDSAESLLDKINRIDAIIDGLILQQSTSTGNSNIASYQLNDGQTVINTSYTSQEMIMKAIEGFERLRARYLLRLNGNGAILRDWRGMR
jgi:hypothetical protein